MGITKQYSKGARNLLSLLGIVGTIALSSCNPLSSFSSSGSSSEEGSSSASSSSSEVSSSTASSSVNSSSADESSASSTVSNSSQESSSSVDDSPIMSVYAIEQTNLYGDCTLFSYGDIHVLIDGGNEDSASALQTALNTYVTNHVLDLLVLTHPHSDHYGGFASNATLLNGGITTISTIVDSGADSYSSTSYYASSWVNGIRKYWMGKGAQYYPVESLVDGTYDAHMSFGNDMSVTFLDTGNYTTPGGVCYNSSSADPNATSVALSLHFGKSDFVMVGDLPTGAEADLVKRNPTLSAFVPTGDNVIYKAAHHGSSGASSAAFMSYLKPVFAWASAGIDPVNTNSPGPKQSQHPFSAARARIETYTGRNNFWWNGTAGTLTMRVSLAGSFSVSGSGRKTNYYYQGTLVDPESEKDTPLEETKWALIGY